MDEFKKEFQKHKDALIKSLTNAGESHRIYIMLEKVKSNVPSYRYYFEAGQQSQQAKVEETNAKAQMCRDEKNHAINRWSSVCKERDDLKKRVDAAKHYLGNIFTGNSIEDECHLKDLLDILDGKIVEELEQALKGGMRTRFRWQSSTQQPT